MQKNLLTAAALLAISFGRAQTYQQNFNANHNDILAEGWKFPVFAGNPQNNGIYASNSGMAAIGINGGAAGIATFNLVNSMPSTIQNLDCAIISPPVRVLQNSSTLSYKVGNVLIGSTGSCLYTVTIIKNGEYLSAQTPEALMNLIESKTIEDAQVLSGELVGTSLTLEDYVGEEIRVVFRAQFPAGNTILFVDDFRITNGTLDSDEFRAQPLAIYPNPADNLLTVNYDGIEEIIFTDINGRTVSSAKYNNPDTVQVDVSQFAQGIYIMAVKNAYGITTKKVIKS